MIARDQISAKKEIRVIINDNGRVASAAPLRDTFNAAFPGCQAVSLRSTMHPTIALMQLMRPDLRT